MAATTTTTRTDIDQPKECKLFSLPFELRTKIYSLVLETPETGKPIDLIGHKTKDRSSIPDELKRTNIMLVSQKLHDDVAQYLYSAYSFAILPVFHMSSTNPSVANIAPRYKRHMRVVRLFLGASWTKPPKSWVVNKKLGLAHLKMVHTLQIFVLCDPSRPEFEGFRKSKEFYTLFATRLLRDILLGLPNVNQVVIDGNPSVNKNGDLVTALEQEIRSSGKRLQWSGLFLEQLSSQLVDSFRAQSIETSS
ncbi:hypothetical protein FQN57_004218 [Myotisia sp. PD_48]|nr:hypothetical protein FQN57_004218 [Myotisia sp. PD_48]